jgi:outer membrane protein
MTKTRFSLSVVAIATALMFASSAMAANTPQPKILVIDRSTILRLSKVGQDIVRQVNAYTQQAENDLKGQSASLRSQGESLKQQLAIMSADVKARKIKDFEARQAGLQQLAQKKQALIQGGFFKARQTVEQALGGVLQGIMAEKGANLLLDRNAVVMGTDASLDVTQLAVQRLDQKMSTLKVDLVMPPPGLMQQQQQAQQ